MRGCRYCRNCHKEYSKGEYKNIEWGAVVLYKNGLSYENNAWAYDKVPICLECI